MDAERDRKGTSAAALEVSPAVLFTGGAAAREFLTPVTSRRNLPELAEALAMIRSQAEWFAVMLASISDAVITTDSHGRIAYLNPGAEQITGWKLAGAKGQLLEKVFQLVNDQTAEPAMGPIGAGSRKSVVADRTERALLLGRDRTRTAIEHSAAPIRDAAGGTSGAVTVFREVARQSHADDLLHDRKQRLSAMLDQAAVGMATVGLDGRLDHVNRRLGEMLGYSVDELVGRTFRELTFADDLPATDAAVRRLLNGEISHYAIEKRYVRKEGSVRWSLTTATLIKDESGQPLRLVKVLEDITQRRRAEEALQARERELSLIYNSVSDIIFFLAAEPAGEFRFVTVNRAFLSATGLLESQVVGKRVSEVIPEPSLSLVLGHYREAIRTKQTVRWEETTAYPSGRKTGSVSVTAIFDSSGKCVNLIGTVHDVSQRWHTEEVSARLAAVVESSDDAIVSKTLEGVIVTWNQGAERMFGYTAAEAVGQPIEMLIPPNRIDEEPEILRRIKLGERVEHYETVRRRKDGTLLDVSVTISPIRDTKGLITGVSKIARNITAQKQTEEVLRESEARYRIMGQVVPHLLWVTDARGIPIYFNDRWYAYTGQDERSTSETERRSALHPDDQEEATASWMHAVETGEPFECEYRIRRHDGAYRWFIGRGVPLQDGTGKILRWYGSSTDVHEQKLTAEALREQYIVTEQLNGVARALATELDLNKIVQIITDAGTRITRAQFGAFFQRQVGEHGESYSLRSFSGRPREAFATLPVRGAGIFEPIFRGEELIRLDDLRLDDRFEKSAPRDGTSSEHSPVVSYLAVPVISRTGAVLGGLFFGHGEPAVFTERDEKIIVGVAAQAAAAMDNARLYQAEQHARSAAEHANQAKDDFLATLSHELRNPLNPVLLIASEAAENQDLPAEIRADLEVIQRNVELETRLIEDLLDLTSITRRKMSLELRSVEVHEVIREAIAIVRRDADEKNIVLGTHFLDGKAAVMGDPARLQQIFWNVLRNAVKFTPNGGHVRVQTRKIVDPYELEVEISASGIGMTAEEISRIFEAFRQGDHASSTGAHRFGGLGFGLAIAQYLVQMHGGRIEAESSGANQGSTFRITFPLLDAVL